MGTDFVVYKHTTPSNKVYIGITCQNPKKRWQCGYGYSKCPLFYKAIQKYGWDNISHEILYENLTKEEAVLKEIELIEQYDSINHKKGYNLTKGGDGNFGVVFTEERKQNISKAKKGHKVSEETRNKIRKSQSGTKHWNFGKKLSDEIKSKISKAHKGKKFTKEHISKLPQLWEKGHIPWNKNTPIDEETRTKIINNSKRLPVLCVETNVEYCSLREASRKNNISVSKISEVCKGKRKTAGGYHWRLVGGVE